MEDLLSEGRALHLAFAEKITYRLRKGYPTRDNLFLIYKLNYKSEESCIQSCCYLSFFFKFINASGDNLIFFFMHMARNNKRPFHKVARLLCFLGIMCFFKLVGVFPVLKVGKGFPLCQNNVFARLFLT